MNSRCVVLCGSDYVDIASCFVCTVDQWEVQEVVKKIVAELVSAHAAHHYIDMHL